MSRRRTQITWKVNEAGCHVCTSHYLDRCGYPMTHFQRKQTHLSREVYCRTHNLNLLDIEGLEIRHTCDTPACINPDHLILGTHIENMADQISRGRRARCCGSLNGRAKLSEQIVLLIKQDLKKKETQKFIAKKYNISRSVISLIANHKIWLSVGG